MKPRIGYLSGLRHEKFLKTCRLTEVELGHRQMLRQKKYIEDGELLGDEIAVGDPTRNHEDISLSQRNSPAFNDVCSLAVVDANQFDIFVLMRLHGRLIFLQ